MSRLRWKLSGFDVCELLTRRAADEGAVTVEGWMQEDGFKEPWAMIAGDGTVLRVHRERGDHGFQMVPVSVTIRRKP